MSNVIKWACSICTYHHDESISQCAVCATPRNQKPSTIDDEAFARQLQAEFDGQAQDQPQTPGSNHNHNHNRRRPKPSTPSDNDSSDQMEMLPSSNSNSLEPRMESLTTVIKSKPSPIQTKPRRSSRFKNKACIAKDDKKEMSSSDEQDEENSDSDGYPSHDSDSDYDPDGYQN